jgi:hypothetical protein
VIVTQPIMDCDRDRPFRPHRKSDQTSKFVAVATFTCASPSEGECDTRPFGKFINT